MIKYIVVSDKFEGFLVFGFDKVLGYLIEFRNCAWKITEGQTRTILQNLAHCLTASQFIEWARANDITFYKDNIDLSFAAWYRIYDRARDKKDAEAFWNKKNDVQRLHIHWKTEAYHRYLSAISWKTKMYPKTFLSSHLGDEFDKLRIQELKEKK